MGRSNGNKRQSSLCHTLVKNQKPNPKPKLGNYATIDNIDNISIGSMDIVNFRGDKPEKHKQYLGRE